MEILTITIDFKIEDIVYLKTDPDQHARMVTGITFRGTGNILYELVFGTITSSHYACEMSKEIDNVKKFTSD